MFGLDVQSNKCNSGSIKDMWWKVVLIPTVSLVLSTMVYITVQKKVGFSSIPLLELAGWHQTGLCQASLGRPAQCEYIIWHKVHVVEFIANV